MESTISDNAVNSSREVSVLKASLAACFTFAVHLFVTILILGFLIRMVPVYQEFFDRFDVSLPTPTQFLILLSIRASQYWYLVFLTLLVIDGPLAFGVQFLPNNMQWLRGCWFSSYLLIAIVFLFFSQIPLLMTITGMLQSVAGA